MLTLPWFLFLFSFFLSWICVKIWSPLACACKMKMSKPERIAFLQTDHLLLTHELGWCLRPSLWPVSFSESEDAPSKPSNLQSPAPTFPSLFLCHATESRKIWDYSEGFWEERAYVYTLYIYSHTETCSHSQDTHGMFRLSHSSMFCKSLLHPLYSLVSLYQYLV